MIGVTTLTKPISRETLGQYRHYGKTIILTLFADCVSLRLKSTRKEKAYQLPIPHLMGFKRTTPYSSMAAENSAKTLKK
jgi:hypothetical protein